MSVKGVDMLKDVSKVVVELIERYYDLYRYRMTMISDPSLSHHISNQAGTDNNSK
jgi:hypothetical protein